MKGTPPARTQILAPSRSFGSSAQSALVLCASAPLRPQPALRRSSACGQRMEFRRPIDRDSRAARSLVIDCRRPHRLDEAVEQMQIASANRGRRHAQHFAARRFSSDVISAGFSEFEPLFTLRTRSRLLGCFPSADTVHGRLEGGSEDGCSRAACAAPRIFPALGHGRGPRSRRARNPEGVTVRVRFSRRAIGRQAADSGGRARTSSRSFDESRPQIRSGSVTGSRQRAHLPR